MFQRSAPDLGPGHYTSDDCTTARHLRNCRECRYGRRCEDYWLIREEEDRLMERTKTAPLGNPAMPMAELVREPRS